MTAAELKLLRAVRNCTDEAGLPIMSHEGAPVVALERAGMVRVIGEHSNRLCILEPGREALEAAE